VARFPHAARGFYLVQDFEPMFYPAGALYALAEETYRFGLYGLCNTERLLDLYRRDYGGVGGSFMPAVDRSVFHPVGRREPPPGEPVTVFVYSRPGHWRNSWEIASIALGMLKERLGDGVRIVTAGSWARPEDRGTGIRHLGLLDYKATGELYRHCDIGVALTLSEHPSYLPLEFMASGATVVAFDNPAGHWLLRDGENALLTRRTVDGLADGLERLVRDPQLRGNLRDQARRDIEAGYGDWERALSGIYDILTDPDAPR
jgi:glycosyltransferase involved in cell wall biosynthesis